MQGRRRACAITCDTNRTATELEGLFIAADIKSPALPALYCRWGKLKLPLPSALRCYLQCWENPVLLNIPLSRLGEKKHPGSDCVGVNALVWAELGQGGGRRAGRGGEAFRSGTEWHKLVQGRFLLKARERGKRMMAPGCLQENATLRCPAKDQFCRCQCHVRQKRRKCQALVPAWMPALLPDECSTDVLPVAGGMQGGASNLSLLPMTFLC